MTVLYLPARAKLNLVLRVVGRRPDGYHLLETLFHTIELCDELWLEAQGGGDIELALTGGGAGIPGDGDNLVVRALRALAAASGTGIGFRARLAKRIPAGGGLGGGSSDAAAALRLGNALLAEREPARALSSAGLHELARGLGADVPFLLEGGSRWGHGIGDELHPAAVPPMQFVLLVPPYPCPTAEVYKFHAAHWNDGGAQGTCVRQRSPAASDGILRIEFSNDLTMAAEAVRPELAELRQRAGALAGVPAHVTGSGSTLFLAFPAAADAAVAAALQALAPLRQEGVGLVRTRSAGGLDPPRAIGAG
ncbi:MAG: 4-(cytidine 5'-diphospho)-2-C-methyl-D-erythritol kinase [Planctomycetes bacterium]|nr:4-(cytidine 5'-diphospho)-2-C-methyl-D-erythritol kinase [Planctomycetota bacterium]